MPWSGSAPNQTFVRSTGTQTGATAWQLEDAAGTRVVAAKFDTHDQDIADGLSACLKRDGGNKPTANIPMGTFKLTGLGSGSATDDSATFGQVQSQVQSSIIAHAASVGGTADAITATFSPVFTAYTAKMRFRFTAGGANTITNPTINVDGLGTKTIKKNASAALAVGDIAGSGHVCDCVYDGTDVLLLNPAATTPTSVGKHTIFVPASAMVARSTNGATSLTLESTTNKVMRQALAFSTSTTQYAQFGVAMPKGWNAGTVTARVIWEHPATVTNFGVAWGVQGLTLADDDAFDNAFGTAQVVTDTGGTTNDHYKTAETSAITLSNTPAKGDTAIFQIYRDTANGNDNMAVDAYLFGVELYITTDAATDA